MKQEKQNRIEEVLQAWDGAKRAEAPAYFYTRLRAKMEKENSLPASANWYLKPAFVITTLLAVIAINAFIFFKSSDSSVASVGTEDSIQTIAAEYNLSDNLLEEINP